MLFKAKMISQPIVEDDFLSNVAEEEIADIAKRLDNNKLDAHEGMGIQLSDGYKKGVTDFQVSTNNGPFVRKAHWVYAEMDGDNIFIKDNHMFLEGQNLLKESEGIYTGVNGNRIIRIDYNYSASASQSAWVK
jgi:hypothetical protein